MVFMSTKETKGADDVREALDEAHVALGVVLAQQNTGHDESTYGVVENAMTSVGVALRGSKLNDALARPRAMSTERTPEQQAAYRSGQWWMVKWCLLWCLLFPLAVGVATYMLRVAWVR